MAAITDGMATVGTRLSVGASTAGTAIANYTAFAFVHSVTGPNMTVTVVDTTAHDSANRYMTFKPGFTDPGTVDFDIRYVPTDNSHDETAGAGALALLGIKTTNMFAVQFPDSDSTVATNGSYFVSAGFLSGFNPQAPLDAALDAALSLKLSGKPTFVSAVG